MCDGKLCMSRKVGTPLRLAEELDAKDLSSVQVTTPDRA